MIEPIIGAFIRLKNRRVCLRRQPDGTLLYVFKRYDPDKQGRKRERVIVTPLALSDEAFMAMAQLYATKERWDK